MNELYISFLFPPSSYVSGINVFKRIVENKNKVDVLHAKLDESVFNFDEVEEYINKRIQVDMFDRDDSAICVFEFIEKSIPLIKKDYEKIYSRSWFSANHFLAFHYKSLHPDVFWTAEFSDPLIYDLSNNIKKYKKTIFDNSYYVDSINYMIDILNEENSTDFPFIKNKDSSFFIAEYIVYLFADKVIFTNENQKEVMLNQFPHDVSDFVLKKCEVKMHSTLDPKFYHIKEVKLSLNENYINIAYFGKDYYGQRHFESLFYAVDSLNHKFKNKLRFYLFVDDDGLLTKLISTLNSSDNFIIKKPMDYFEFLNATTKFDVLLVMDMMTRDFYEKNPYLPSKLSDYVGSNTDIWAIYEKGSTLSKLKYKYESEINDFYECCNQLVKILDDNGFSDEDYYFRNDYFMKRLTDLNKLYEKEYRQNLNSNKKIKMLKKQNRFLLDEKNKILSSNSWKLTKPLRILRNKK